jgi:hypothetical protein
MDPIIRITDENDPTAYPTDDYVVLTCGSSRVLIGSLPSNDDFQYVKINTGTFTYINHISVEIPLDRVRFERDDPNAESSITINQIKSALIFTLRENFDASMADKFYWKLKMARDEANTREYHYFQLFYDIYPIEMSIHNSLRKMFDIASKNAKGTILLTSDNLSVTGPKWVIREFFRDIIEMNETNNFILSQIDNTYIVEGPSTGELYLFGDTIDSYLLDSLIDYVIDTIESMMKAKLWPRHTPEYYQKNKALVKVANGQYTYNEKIPKEWLNYVISKYSVDYLYQDVNTWIGTAETPNQLYTFLFKLQGPTWTYLKSELHVRVCPNEMTIYIRTAFIWDILRVIYNSMYLGEESEHRIQYGVDTNESDNEIIFWNSAIQSWVWVAPKEKLPVTIYDEPREKTIDDRLRRIGLQEM